MKPELIAHDSEAAASGQRLVTGYPKLANRMALLPETAIFRRFSSLNIQDLLYQQAHLQDLEGDLRNLELRDNTSQEGRKSSYATNWYWLSNSKDDGNDEQLRLVKEIRRCLKDYNEALSRQCILHRWGSKPGKWDLKDLQHYLASPEMEIDGQRCFDGVDYRIWGSIVSPESYSPDLVSFRARAPSDKFSSWIMTTCISRFFKWTSRLNMLEPNHQFGFVAVADRVLLKFTMAVTTIVASSLCIAGITVLWRVNSMPTRLALIAVFNVLLCICLMVFTNAARHEIFAISAAFSAVQVVFVAVNDASGSQMCAGRGI